MRRSRRIDERHRMTGAAQIFGRPRPEYTGAYDRDAGFALRRDRDWQHANVAAPPVRVERAAPQNYRGAAWTAHRPPSISPSERLTEGEADSAGPWRSRDGSGCRQLVAQAQPRRFVTDLLAQTRAQNPAPFVDSLNDRAQAKGRSDGSGAAASRMPYLSRKA